MHTLIFCNIPLSKSEPVIKFNERLRPVSNSLKITDVSGDAAILEPNRQIMARHVKIRNAYQREERLLIDVW